MTEREGPLVTIDGPAGSGKSSTATEVARRLDFRHLDSGALYRALTLALMRTGIPEAEWRDLGEEALALLDVGVQATPTGFDVQVDGLKVAWELRTDAVTRRVSQVARLPAVRGRLIDLQRAAGAAGRLVAEGRDMGTVVFPDAEVKVFLVADLEERTRRRLREQGIPAPDAATFQEQMEGISERDRRDAVRKLSPLRPAPDAHRIDTTGLAFEEQVGQIVELVHRLTHP